MPKALLMSDVSSASGNTAMAIISLLSCFIKMVFQSRLGYFQRSTSTIPRNQTIRYTWSRRPVLIPLNSCRRSQRAGAMTAWLSCATYASATRHSRAFHRAASRSEGETEVTQKIALHFSKVLRSLRASLRQSGGPADPVLPETHAWAKRGTAVQQRALLARYSFQRLRSRS